MSEKPPYIAQPGMITKALEKIQAAATPNRFTHDYLSTKLKMKGGNARQTIPFLKKIGFLASDGTPTSLYVQFRNSSKSGAAMAEATRTGYSTLYEVNEYAHDLTDKELKDLIIEVTGLEKKNKVVDLTASCFNRLKELASFDETIEPESPLTVPPFEKDALPASLENSSTDLGMNLSYTINLNLPPTSDVEVFNAIFKSLKENLLKNG